MKQRAVTVEGIRFAPHWWRDYVGTINGRKVWATRVDSDWIVGTGIWLTAKTLGGGRTLREAVRMAKDRG